jgi:zinc transporter ZupT
LGLYRIRESQPVPGAEEGDQGAESWLYWLVPLSAGVFAGAAVFEVLPSAITRAGRDALLWTLVGLGVFVLMRWVLDALGGHGAAWSSTLGMWLHSFFEGVVTAVGYGVSPAVGLALTLVLVVHLAPEVTALVAVLMGTGLSLRQALVRSAVTWLLIVAGLLAVRFLPLVPPPVLGAGMAFGGGGLLYLAYVSWMARRGELGGRLAAALVGVAIMGIVGLTAVARPGI